MSTLIILLAAQPRLAATSSVAPPVPREFDYVFSTDGQRVTQHGTAAAAAMPRAATVTAVVPPADAAFQRLTVPRAPAARMRTALIGVLEEGLLEEDADVHLALAPEARPGAEHWVAVVNKPWLKAQLDALEAANLAVDRVVPAWPPDDGIAGHVWRPDSDGPAWLAWRDPQGVLCVPLANELARQLAGGVPVDAPVRWSATPEAAAEASEFALQPVASVTMHELALLALPSGWNLLQFDLTPQRRGVKLVREIAMRFAFDPVWRVTRIGLATLVAVQLVGLNLRAWQEQHAIALRQQALTAAVQAGFPGLRTVYDASGQAAREIDRLRAAAGRPGDGDLETLLAAAESAWPPAHSPVASLQFEPGRLTLPASGWSPPEIDRFASQLRAAGIRVDRSGDKFQLARLPAAAGTTNRGGR